MTAITFWSFLGLRLRQASEGKRGGKRREEGMFSKEGYQIGGLGFLETASLCRQGAAHNPTTGPQSASLTCVN